MFHWHFDTFDLPRLPPPPPPPAGAPPGPPPATGNALLSSSKACKNQAFRFKNRLFGFQYHIELDERGIERMIEGNKGDLEGVLGSAGREQIVADTKQYYSRYARLGDRVLRNFVQFLRLY
jgi:GMP synthase-like glutamine amidotransferase